MGHFSSPFAIVLNNRKLAYCTTTTDRVTGSSPLDIFTRNTPKIEVNDSDSCPPFFSGGMFCDGVRNIELCLHCKARR